MTRPVLTLVLGVLLTSVAQSADFVQLAGSTSSGTLVEVGAETVTYRTAEGTLAKIPVKSLAAINLGNKVIAPKPDARYDEIELTDGSVLKIEQLTIPGKAVLVTPLAGPAGVPTPKLTIPLGTLNSLLRGAEDPAHREAWRKLLTSRGKRDLFVVRQASGLGPLPGTVIEGSAEGDRVTFEREDGQRVNLPLSRATGGIVFNQPPRDVIPPTICKLHDVFGNVLYVTAIEVAGSGLKAKTVSGAEVAYADLAGVSKLDFSQGNLSYLSDLNAQVNSPPVPKDEPLVLKPAQDRTVFGHEIVIAGRKFTKGVSVPRGTTLVYGLDGSFREFKALAGIPDGDNRSSWVLRLRIEVDGRVVLDAAISQKDRLKEITLNVKDAKEVQISVESEGLFAGSELSLAEARFQK